MELEVTLIEDEFYSFISQKDFPCVGAKTALTRNNIHLSQYGDLLSSDSDVELLANLYEFIENFDINTDMYSSFVAVFDSSRDLSEVCFEKALWQKLQALHDLDSKLYPWDKNVSANPADSDFSFSLGQHAFFIIGLNPYSSRKSRQFAYPAIVFNLHRQFEQLRRDGKFEQFRDHIRQRDEQYSGSKNPMLASYGEDSEALQYSGRHIEDGWQCPFSQKKGATI